MAGIFVNIRCPNKQQSIHDYKNNRAIDSHLFSPAYICMGMLPFFSLLIMITGSRIALHAQFN